jgi:hypothetical protein
MTMAAGCLGQAIEMGLVTVYQQVMKPAAYARRGGPTNQKTVLELYIDAMGRTYCMLFIFFRKQDKGLTP